MISFEVGADVAALPSRMYSQYEVVQIGNVALTVIPATHIIHQCGFRHWLLILLVVSRCQDFSDSLVRFSPVGFHGEPEYRHDISPIKN